MTSERRRQKVKGITSTCNAANKAESLIFQINLRFHRKNLLSDLSQFERLINPVTVFSSG